MPEWLIYHYDENSQPVGSFKPNITELSWDLMEGVSITYEIALSDTHLLRDSFAPKRTTWALYNYGNLVDKGIHSNRNLKLARDTVSVQGRSYLWYLDNRVYPFDPRRVRPYEPGRQHQWFQVTRKSIVEILIGALQTNFVPNSNTLTGFFSSPYSYPMGVSGDSGGLINYQFDFADQRTILGHIKDLAQGEDGFDYRFDPVSLNLILASPSFDNGTPVFTFDETLGTPDPVMIDIDWNDDGPEATFTWGLGAGTQDRSFGWISTYQPSLQTYHRWDKVEDMGEVKNNVEIRTRTASKGLLQRYPQKRLTITVDASEELQGFWSATMPRNLVGRRIYLRYDFSPYHKIDSAYVITNLSLNPDTDGNVLATMSGEIVN